MSSTALKEAPNKTRDHITPNQRQTSRSIQKFGTVISNLPLGLSEDLRVKTTAALNLILADTISLRDMYKKHHWQVGGPTFYQLHLLFDKHFGEQAELVDLLAERIQTLGGISIAMAHDVAEMTRLERPPRDREEVPVQISRLLEAHKLIVEDARKVAKTCQDKGDDGTNDILVSNVIRTNELQVWFISEHLVDMPLVRAD
jgi:starvation-inducible DNA-binding protein